MIVEDLLKTITEEIADMVSTKTVIGEHIIVEGKTIIPVTKVSFGFGSGGGEGKKKAGEGRYRRLWGRWCFYSTRGFPCGDGRGCPGI